MPTKRTRQIKAAMRLIDIASRFGVTKQTANRIERCAHVKSAGYEVERAEINADTMPQPA